MTGPRSPLKTRPLRNPGQSLDEEIQRAIDDRATLRPSWQSSAFGSSRVSNGSAHGAIFPAALVVHDRCACGHRLARVARVSGARSRRTFKAGSRRRTCGRPVPGRSSRSWGTHLSRRSRGWLQPRSRRVISRRGIYVVETKTITKPGPDARVVFDGEQITVAGHRPDRDPVKQASAEATWLHRLLDQSTGRAFPVRGVVVYPGWWVERTNRNKNAKVWVLEPKALPAFIENAPAVISPDDVALAAYHLSRYIRGENRS